MEWRPISKVLHRMLAKSRKRLDAAEARLKNARDEVDLCEVEVAAFERALAAVSSDSPEPPEQPDAPQISTKWAAIYTALYRTQASPYDYDAILRAAKSVGESVNPNSLRPQMMHSVRRGIFDRCGPGRFELTPIGHAALPPPPTGEDG